MTELTALIYRAPRRDCPHQRERLACVDCRRELHAAAWWALLGGIVLGAWLALAWETIRGWL